MVAVPEHLYEKVRKNTKHGNIEVGAFRMEEMKVMRK